MLLLCPIYQPLYLEGVIHYLKPSKHFEINIVFMYIFPKGNCTVRLYTQPVYLDQLMVSEILRIHNRLTVYFAVEFLQHKVTEFFDFCSVKLVGNLCFWDILNRRYIEEYSLMVERWA